MSVVLRLIRFLITLAILAVAVFIVVQLWNVYMLAPWTRDGRVFAQTVVVAPEVSGTVVSMPLRDNEAVTKGQVLYQIDKSRFQIALAQAQADLDAAQLQEKKAQDDVARRRGLSGLISKEDVVNTGIASSVASANVEGAQAAVDLAKLNLARSTIYAPVSGVVSHLRLQAGDFATAGHPDVALIDTGSFKVIGYFEETKISKIHIGDAVSIKLMGFPQRLTGQVSSIGLGIANQNDAANPNGLPEVNPVFDWVRLAQRIPVYVAIDQLPAGVVLASGMTCSVNVGREVPVAHGITGRVQSWFEDNL
ncbi:HlyD family secretion protein [Acidisoma cellulosilytica]|uniref:HlyD family secretion protein n=1 Tax=Acidisoma cellulosilyticum TaxID=2802395 RepID=A0A963Z399_9PROT|nr:HlyD family secretion protein [Acidisoma cellulosilyticum]MCB8881811.1 HlyD family secretion protein [Acidisoma cellulosilyticum]